MQSRRNFSIFFVGWCQHDCFRNGSGKIARSVPSDKRYEIIRQQCHFVQSMIIIEMIRMKRSKSMPSFIPTFRVRPSGIRPASRRSLIPIFRKKKKLINDCSKEKNSVTQESTDPSKAQKLTELWRALIIRAESLYPDAAFCRYVMKATSGSMQSLPQCAHFFLRYAQFSGYKYDLF